VGQPRRCGDPGPDDAEPDCGACDDQPSPVAAGAVGLFEGRGTSTAGCPGRCSTAACEPGHRVLRVCVAAVPDVARQTGSSPCLVANAVYGDPRHPMWRRLPLARRHPPRAPWRPAMRPLAAGQGAGPVLARLVQPRPRLARLLGPGCWTPSPPRCVGASGRCPDYPGHPEQVGRLRRFAEEAAGQWGRHWLQLPEPEPLHRYAASPAAGAHRPGARAGGRARRVLDTDRPRVVDTTLATAEAVLTGGTPGQLPAPGHRYPPPGRQTARGRTIREAPAPRPRTRLVPVTTFLFINPWPARGRAPRASAPAMVDDGWSSRG
jgi:hypothetical protein